MSTVERMDKMEGQLVRIRWINRCLIACIVLSLGVWFISKTFTTETAWAGSGVKEIRAKSFVLEDENGKARGGMEIVYRGAVLWLWDENRKVRAGLWLNTEGPALVLFDENDKARARLSVNKNGPGLRLYDENEKVIWSAP